MYAAKSASLSCVAIAVPTPVPITTCICSTILSAVLPPRRGTAPAGCIRVWGGLETPRAGRSAPRPTDQGGWGRAEPRGLPGPPRRRGRAADGRGGGVRGERHRGLVAAGRVGAGARAAAGRGRA